MAGVLDEPKVDCHNHIFDPADAGDLFPGAADLDLPAAGRRRTRLVPPRRGFS